MAPSQEMKISDSKTFWKIVLTIFLMSVAIFLFIGSDFHSAVVNVLMVPHDKHGHKPRDIAKAFLEAARSGDYRQAAEYWTDDSLKVFQRNTRGIEASLESFCDYFQPIISYTIPPATPSEEGGNYWLYVRGKLADGSPRGYQLFFELVDNEWKLM